MRPLIAFLVLIAAAAPASADSSLPAAQWADRQLPDVKQEKAARALMDEIRCLVCDGQAVGDSDAELAGDMRHLIRTRIAQGHSAAQVRAWLVDRYGDSVTYRPPARPVAWPLWLAPLLLLAAGFYLMRGRVRLRRRG